MIVAVLHKIEGGKMLMILMEPGNFAKLELGQPIIKKLAAFIPDEEIQDVDICIAYTPDPEWVEAQVAAGEDLDKAIVRSLSREKVYRRSMDGGVDDAPLVRVI